VQPRLVWQFSCFSLKWWGYRHASPHLGIIFILIAPMASGDQIEKYSSRKTHSTFIMIDTKQTSIRIQEKHVFPLKT
jgi:hypothetical protein